MSYALTYGSDLFRISPPAMSEDAKKLDASLSMIRTHNDESIFLGWRRELKEKVQECVERCAEEGWDGEDALPISEPSQKAAKLFIDLLPEAAEIPDIEPENMGNFSFDWSRGKNKILSISVFPEKAVFAGIFGNDRLHGEVVIQNEIPEKINSLLHQYFSR